MHASLSILTPPAGVLNGLAQPKVTAAVMPLYRDARLPYHETDLKSHRRYSLCPQHYWSFLWSEANLFSDADLLVSSSADDMERTFS